MSQTARSKTKTKKKEEGRHRRPPSPKADGAIRPIVVEALTSSLNGRPSRYGQPNLPEMDRLVHGVIAAKGQWVLIDRHEVVRGEREGSSSRYIALKRRGFHVVVRHVDGVRNFWARWPHPEPTLPDVTRFEFDDEFTAYGQAPD